MNEYMGGEPWSWSIVLTPEQRLELTNAFGPFKRKYQSSSVAKFVFHADRYVLRFPRDFKREPPKAVKAQLLNAADAASQLVSALSDLNEEARHKIILAGSELKNRTGSTGRREKDLGKQARRGKRRAENNVDKYGIGYAMNYRLANAGFEEFESGLGRISREITCATQAFRVTQGTRLNELIAADIVSDLFLTWFTVFQKKGSLTPGMEFHRVAAVVANLLGLKIGSKTLARADDGRLTQRLASGYYARKR